MEQFFFLVSSKRRFVAASFDFLRGKGLRPWYLSASSIAKRQVEILWLCVPFCYEVGFGHSGMKRPSRDVRAAWSDLTSQSANWTIVLTQTVVRLTTCTLIFWNLTTTDNVPRIINSPALLPGDQSYDLPSTTASRARVTMLRFWTCLAHRWIIFLCFLLSKVYPIARVIEDIFTQFSAYPFIRKKGKKI